MARNQGKTRARDEKITRTIARAKTFSSILWNDRKIQSVQSRARIGEPVSCDGSDAVTSRHITTHLDDDDDDDGDGDGDGDGDALDGDDGEDDARDGGDGARGARRAGVRRARDEDADEDDDGDADKDGSVKVDAVDNNLDNIKKNDTKIVNIDK